MDYEGKNISTAIINLNENLNHPKWDTLKDNIKRDKIFDEMEGEDGYFF